MQDYRMSNKISSILWLKSSVNRLSIRIKLKPREGVVEIPKYNETTTVKYNNIEFENDLSKYYVFKWNEKVFSRWEFYHYSEVNNCVLDYENEYYRKIHNNDFKMSQMFTRLENDKDTTMSDTKNNVVESPLFEKIRGRITSDITSSTRHLFKSELELNSNDENLQTMHVVWDSSEYNDDNQLLFKEETVLLSLYYNPTNNSLLMSPRENDVHYNSYDVYTDAGRMLGFQYGVEIIEEEDDDEELIALLNKLNAKLEKKQNNILRFDMPPPGKNTASLHFEILGAANFGRDNVYVEYTIMIPDKIKCTGQLHGRTHVSKMLEDGSRRWNFGHDIDLELEYDKDSKPPPITIYFEAVSVDWWRRHRTEGYAYIKPTLLPSKFEETLSCRRPEELDKREAERRRFFVGECHLIKDLRVLDHPQDYDTNFRYITSGDITVRWNIITQTHNLGSMSSGPSSASRLLRGAEDALQQYSRAKATLASATEDLDAIYGSGDRRRGFIIHNDVKTAPFRKRLKKEEQINSDIVSFRFDCTITSIRCVHDCVEKLSAVEGNVKIFEFESMKAVTV